MSTKTTNKGTRVRHAFAQSTSITTGRNWFMILAGKAAEPVLVMSVLYPLVNQNAEVVQSHLRGQASVKTGQIVRPFASQTKDVQQVIIDGLNDLPQMSQPTVQRFGPALLASLMRRSQQIHLVHRWKCCRGFTPANPSQKIRTLS